MVYESTPLEFNKDLAISLFAPHCDILCDVGQEGDVALTLQGETDSRWQITWIL